MGDKIVIVGDYGSGKTEFSLNLAVKLAEKDKVALVDLDIVNPYFRSRQATELLAARGVEVIYNRSLRDADLPALSPRVDTVLAARETVIIDVGGDDGAIVLGRYRARLVGGQVKVWQVVNCMRPFTATAAGIAEAAQRISRKSGLKVTGLVNNTNLGRETTAAAVRHGATVVAQAARKMGVPVLWHSARPHLLPQLQDLQGLFAMEISLFPQDIL